MLLQILIHDPQQLATIASKTPHWVWGLLAALMLLGASQLPNKALQAGFGAPIYFVCYIFH